MSWPDGPGTSMHLLGRARDLLTDPDGGAVVLAEDAVTAVLSPLRTIEAIDASPGRSRIGELVGASGGKGFRAAVDASVPEDRARHTPLALLLDDIAGTSLVAGFAWSRVRSDWMAAQRAAAGSAGGGVSLLSRTMVGICSGFRPGSSALGPDGTSVGGGHHVAPVASLVDPDDPEGWHALAALAEVGLRRARRMDVWRDGHDHRVDAHFRDSCRDPQLGEVAVHEYRLSVTVDADLVVSALHADALVLPYAECPGAAPHVDRLIGEGLADLRRRVLDVLQGVDCCTHLNDALRALADVTVLLPLTTAP